MKLNFNLLEISEFLNVNLEDYDVEEEIVMVE